MSQTCVVSAASIPRPNQSAPLPALLNLIAELAELDRIRKRHRRMRVTVESYSEPLFRAHLANAILWAAGDL